MTRRLLAVAALVAVAAAATLGAQAVPSHPKLRNPAALKEKAPETYKATFDTSAGVFAVQVHRDWAPLGADRFYNLVKAGFYDDVRFHRVISNFMVQFGINGSPSVGAIWRQQKLKDDPVKQSNKRGYITFATAGPDTRTTQVFINFKDNAFLDSQGFAPFGEVTEGMEVVDKLYAEYGARAANAFVRIENEGTPFVKREFPKLDYVKKATVEP